MKREARRFVMLSHKSADIVDVHTETNNPVPDASEIWSVPAMEPVMK